MTPETALMNAQGHVADPKLAEAGVNRIEWAEREMPVLRQVKARFEKEKPLRGRRIAAEFRADYSRGFNDPDLLSLIGELSQQSSAFRLYWQEQAVLRREGGERRFKHPIDGLCSFLQSTMILASDPGIKLVILAPAHEAARAAS